MYFWCHDKNERIWLCLAGVAASSRRRGVGFVSSLGSLSKPWSFPRAHLTFIRELFPWTCLNPPWTHPHLSMYCHLELTRSICLPKGRVVILLICPQTVSYNLLALSHHTVVQWSPPHLLTSSPSSINQSQPLRRGSFGEVGFAQEGWWTFCN